MFELNIELFNIAYNELKNNMDLLLDCGSLFKDLKSNIPDCIKNKQDEVSQIISDYFSCEKNDLEIAKQMLTIKQHLEEASYQEQANSQKKDDGGFFNSAFNAIKDTCAAWGNGVSGVFRGEGLGGVGNAMAQTGATIYVASNSLVSGVAKVGETLGDGVAWVGGMSASGWVSLFNKDASNNIKNSTMNYIRRDLVGEDNQKFFENEAIGKWINSKSNLKYDSSAASGFQTGAEFASKIALATAATVFTGGAAAPVVIGAAYGIGNEEEKYAQSVNIELGEAYDYKKVFGRAVIGGVSGAAEFYGYGQLGSGIVNGIKGLKSGASTIDATKDIGKFSTSFRKNFAKNFFVTDTLLDTGAVITKHGIGYAIGDESREQLLKEGGLELAFSLGLAAIGSGLAARKEVLYARKNPKDVFFSQFDSTIFTPSAYGVDQNALADVTKLKRINNDWLDDPHAFKEFLNKTLNNPDDIDNIFNIFVNKGEVSTNCQKFIIDYLSENYDDVNVVKKIYDNSFETIKSNSYDRIINKFTNLGLTEEETIDYLKRINAQGACSYAAPCNAIVSSFQDKPDEFKKLFGFDLYTEIDGKKIINSQDLLSDFYTFANTKTNVEGAKLFDMVDDNLKILSKNAGDQVYISNSLTYNSDIINDYFKSKSSDYGIFDVDLHRYYPTDLDFLKEFDSDSLTTDILKNQIQDYLDEGYNVELDVFRNKDKDSDKIFTFFNRDGSKNVSTNDWNEGGGHAVFVTAVTDDEVVVSSWGERQSIKLNDFIGNMFNINCYKIGKVGD